MSLMRSLAAIDADLYEVEAELHRLGSWGRDEGKEDHARMATLHERAARLWAERGEVVGGA